MDKLRVLIADDELPARNKMKRMLGKIQEIELIHISENGVDALDKIHTLEPDLVILDIEMPGLTGLEVAEKIEAELTPSIIFATAYNAHAIKAFELSAVDYLLKPFNEERLRLAVEKVLGKRAHLEVDKSEKPIELKRAEMVEELKQPFSNKIPIPTRDRYKLVDFEEIVCIEVEDRNTRLYTQENSYLLTHTLDAFERKLPDGQFFRVNRSCIIGLGHIEEIVIWFGNRFKIILKNGMEVVSSREKSRVLKQVLKF